VPPVSRTNVCVLNWPAKSAGTRRISNDESIARHRADAARKKTARDPAKRWAHLTEIARQRDVEQRGREDVADLYE
jgi:hypothetical protein